VGDATSGQVRLSFNPQLRVEFRGATVTSDAGLLLPRELDERLGLDRLIERHLADPRPPPDRPGRTLAEDPTSRMLASRERRETSVALTSTLHWFETEVLAEERNYQGLARLNTELVPREATGVPPRDPRYRQLRESGARRPRAVRVQWPLRVRLLSSALCLQPGG